MGIWWLFGIALLIVLFDESVGALAVWCISAIVYWSTTRTRESGEALQRELAQLRAEMYALQTTRRRLDDVAPPAPTEEAAAEPPIDDRGFPIQTDPISEPATAEPRTARFEAREPTLYAQARRPAPAVAASPKRSDELPPPLPPEDVRPESRRYESPVTPVRRRETDASGDAVGNAGSALVRFFTEGNAPVKVGVLLVLAGVGALLKYAVDQDWISFPPELRLGAIAAAAIAAFVFGWRQRVAKPTFSLTLQGGAIGTLYLVVYAALRLYQLISPTTALLMMVLLAAGGLVIAVRQSAQLIAVFASVGGFAAPILASTGSGNYVALFSFYAVLNAFIFAAAWVRAWRSLNLVGFVATFGVGLVWGAQYYAPEHFRNVEPFLILFFLFYVGVGYLYAWKKPTAQGLWVDGTLVFGTPLIAFGYQAALLDGNDLQLAWSALFVAAVHGALAVSLFKREGAETLSNSYLLIAGGFATVAVPLAFGAQWTQGVWALEGLAFVWLGLRQRSTALRGMGALLMVAAGGAWLYYFADHHDLSFATVRLTGAMLIIGSAWFATWLLDRDSPSRLAPVLFLYGAIAYVILSIDQVATRDLDDEIHLYTIPLALLMLIASLSHSLVGFERMRTLGALALGVAFPLAALATTAHGAALSGSTLGAWLFYSVIAIAAIRILQIPSLAHASWLTAIAWLGAHAGYDKFGADVQLAGALVAFALPWMLGALLAARAPAVLSWPMSAERARDLGVPMLVALSAWLFVSLFSAGTATHMPQAPIVNPVELMQMAVLYLLWRWSGDLDDPRGVRQLLIGVSFLAITAATLRGVHHLADVPWTIALLGDRIAQSALSIVWTVLGIGAMIVGARTLRRPLWMAGTTLAGIVVIKLLIVDRQYLGDLPGIVAFLGVGLLLATVGYFAPAPPAEK
jgi:uncharacterized membrane protein